MNPPLPRRGPGPMGRFDDPLLLPGTADGPAQRLGQAVPLSGTPGEAYVERRGVPVTVAIAAGVRFDPDFGGRPAVLVAMRDAQDALAAVHGRYLHARRHEDKMRTVGPGGGAVSVLGGWRADPLVLVEGLFDALSLATCGQACVATIGRWAPWLPAVSAGRVVWLAFDAGRPGDGEAARWTGRLPAAEVRRLPPPPRCQDWNTALRKRGPGEVLRWLREHLPGSATTPP